jgi:histidine triad (HIT) family protein
MSATPDETTNECPICAKHHGEVVGGPVYQDDLIYVHHVFNQEEPTFLGYVRVETQRHLPSFAELSCDEAQAVGLALTRVSRAIKACTGADHVYVFFYGDHVPHLHLHVFARYPGTPQEYWRERVDEWSGSPRGGTAEVAALCDRLRAYLAEGTAASQTH